MVNQLRHTGIDVLGSLPWGTHFCQFFETGEDLLQLLVPFFKTGLENNEFCLWITAEFISEDILLNELREAVPGFDQYLERGAFEIVPYAEWYVKSGPFNAETITAGWIERMNEAIAAGYDGLRANGNGLWLESKDLDNFLKYERELTKHLQGHSIIVLCTYRLAKATAATLLDVAHAHECVVSKRNGRWEILEQPVIKQKKADLKKRNELLEQGMAEKAETLSKLVRELHDEISQRKGTEEKLQESLSRIRSLTEHLQNIREEERTRIAREIHDEFGQYLTVMKMDVSWLNKRVSDGDAVKEKVRDLAALLDSMVGSVRRISSELRPGVLDDLGLVAAMEWQLNEFHKRSGIEASFNEPENEPELRDSTKTSLFRILQESLTNVAKHSNARHVYVSLAEKDDDLVLAIEDDGKGFDIETAARKNTLGLMGMKERIAIMNGTFEIDSKPGNGTKISIVVPLTRNN